MKKVFLLLLMGLSIGGLSTITAQEMEEDMPSMELKDSTHLAKKSYDQQYDYENYLYAFPPKKKNMWAIGIQGGPAWIYGDIRTNTGFSAGLNIQKALGHVFSLRLQGAYTAVSGQDYKATTAGNFRNFETSIIDINLEGVVALNNINFYKKQSKIILYGFAGPGVSMYTTSLDQESANGFGYDYSGIPVATSSDDKGDVLDALDALQDGEYETEVDPAFESTTQMNLAFGAGIALRLGKRVDLNLEYKGTWYSTDFIDGYNVNKAGVNTTNNDYAGAIQIGLSFKIGDREEPLWWVNPLYAPYDDLRQLEADFYDGDWMNDEDEDGVADIFDQEMNTPPNVDVNAKGVALDIDKDGIPDHQDAEPFTPKFAKIDKDGVAMDKDQDGVPDVYDQEPDTEAGALVDAKGYDLSVISKYSAVDIGMVYFDLNSATVKKEFYPELYKVATYMQNNPNARVTVVGHADTRGPDDYNVKLSEKRATAVVDVLVKSFNIDKSRFDINPEGEKDLMVPEANNEGSHYLNRRVVFKIMN